MTTRKSIASVQVAVARKLAVLLHSLRVSAELYEPLRNAQRSRGQAAWRNKVKERSGWVKRR